MDKNNVETNQNVQSTQNEATVAPNATQISAARKAWNVVKTVLVWLVVVFAVVMMVFTVVSKFSVDKNKGVFGVKVFVVLSDSMKATDFAAGDVVVVKNLSIDQAKQLQAGDIVTYQSVNEADGSYGQYITHKIRERKLDSNGNLIGYVTYGTTTNVDDEKIVEPSMVVGKYSFSIPKLGTFLQFLKSTPGFLSCILAPFLFLIVIQGVNVVRTFRKYKAEQNAAIADERAQIANERAETQRMMQELLALKAQMEAEKKSAAQTQQTDASTDIQGEANGEDE